MENNQIVRFKDERGILQHMSLKYRELLVDILKLHTSTNLKIFPEKVNFTTYMTYKQPN